jgi:hypothetical protein
MGMTGRKGRGMRRRKTAARRRRERLGHWQRWTCEPGGKGGGAVVMGNLPELAA